jgi:iron complex outermembrane receptor protein
MPMRSRGKNSRRQRGLTPTHIRAAQTRSRSSLTLVNQLFISPRDKKMKRCSPNKLASAVFATICFPAVVVPALAQQADAQSKAAGDATETIVVSSTKVVQPFEQLTSSVSVQDAKTIEAKGIRNLEDLSKYVANFSQNSTLGAGSLGFLTIRGLGNSPGSWDPSASIYVDDVPYNDFFGYTQSLFGVERIEVLRGPQGTLYGGFAEAGVVDIRSRLPGRKFSGSIAFDASNPKSIRTVVSIAGPVTGADGPQLRLGLSLLDERGESPIRNVVSGKRADHKADAFRLTAVAELTGNVDATVTIMEHRLRDKDGVQYLPLDRSLYNRVIAPSGFSTGRFELANDYAGERSADTKAQSMRLRWRGDAVDVVGVLAHRTFDGPYKLDFDYTPLRAPATPGFGVPFISDSLYRTTNDHVELRLQRAAAASGSFNWIVGVSRMEQDVTLVSDGVFPQGFGAFVPAGGRAGFNDATSDGRNSSVFGQITQRFLDDALGATFGIRRETSQRNGESRPALFGTPAFRGSVSDSRRLPKLSVDYRVDATMTAYATFATGWRPGGVNLYADTSLLGFAGPRTPDPITYRQQRTTTAEVGFNLRSKENQLQLSAAVFQTKVRDYQETVVTGTGTAFLANAAEVKIPGAEFELTWRATPDTGPIGTRILVPSIALGLG